LALIRGHAPELSETSGIPYGPGKVAVLLRETGSLLSVSVDLVSYHSLLQYTTAKKKLYIINTLRNA
jgi:hypothetical protein